MKNNFENTRTPSLYFINVIINTRMRSHFEYLNANKTSWEIFADFALV